MTEIVLYIEDNLATRGEWVTNDKTRALCAAAIAGAIAALDRDRPSGA
jgi:hypothetical protein